MVKTREAGEGEGEQANRGLFPMTCDCYFVQLRQRHRLIDNIVTITLGLFFSLAHVACTAGNACYVVLFFFFAPPTESIS